MSMESEARRQMIDPNGVCAHPKVIRGFTSDETAYVDHWHCDHCGAEFSRSLELYCTPGKLQLMEPPLATMRDQFAIAALNGLLSQNSPDNGSEEFWVADSCAHTKAAIQAYRWAEAMMEARKG